MAVCICPGMCGMAQGARDGLWCLIWAFKAKTFHRRDAEAQRKTIILMSLRAVRGNLPQTTQPLKEVATLRSQ